MEERWAPGARGGPPVVPVWGLALTTASVPTPCQLDWLAPEPSSPERKNFSEAKASSSAGAARPKARRPCWRLSILH